MRFIDSFTNLSNFKKWSERNNSKSLVVLSKFLIIIVLKIKQIVFICHLKTFLMGRIDFFPSHVSLCSVLNEDPSDQVVDALVIGILCRLDFLHI